MALLERLAAVKLQMCPWPTQVVALNSKRPGGDGSRVTCGVVSIEASSGGGQGPLQTLQPRLRPLVFLHGVGWGLVRHSSPDSPAPKPLPSCAPAFLYASCLFQALSPNGWDGDR